MAKVNQKNVVGKTISSGEDLWQPWGNLEKWKTS